MFILRYGIIVVIILFIAIVWTGYGQFVGCHSSKVFTDRHISNPAFSSDGTSVGFILLRKHYRTPQGICTFPDGGRIRILDQSVEVYVVNRNDLIPQKVAERTVAKNLKMSSSTAESVLWKERTLYFRLYEENQGRSTLHYFIAKDNNQTWDIKQVNDSASSNVRARLNKTNPVEWVDYDPNSDLGIVSYIGGYYVKFTNDEENGTVYHPELEDRQINTVWVSKDILNNL